MAREPNPKIREEDLHGFKHFKLLLPIMESLHDSGCGRDKAGNRKLHYDQYAALILLYFFNPIVTSLRAIQQTSQLKKVQRLLGCPRAALGSLSEAARVFDADLLRGIIGELVETLKPINPKGSFGDLQGVLTLVDGTLLPALPKLVEAMWLDRKNKAFKLHTQFELLKGVPVRMDLTHGNANERAVLESTLQSGRVYVMDRGYIKFALFRKIVEAGSSFVCRMRENNAFDILEQRPLSDDALAAQVIRDMHVRFSGWKATAADPGRQLRIVEVACAPHHNSGRRHGHAGPAQGEKIVIASDLLDVPAEVIALIYKHRWAIETFFRFFKHVLGCRHLLSHCENGIQIQTYLAIIACLLIALWTGRKPTLRTYEMIYYYFSGLADEEELLAHIQKLQAQP
jgi:hypothetical protein